MTYSTAFPKHTSGYYVLHGETLTLSCNYPKEIYDMAWLDGGHQIFHAAMPSSGPVTDYINERIEHHVFEGNSHKISITVNKIHDENIIFTCRISTDTGPLEDSHSLHPILSKCSFSEIENELLMCQENKFFSCFMLYKRSGFNHLKHCRCKPLWELVIQNVVSASTFVFVKIV